MKTKPLGPIPAGYGTQDGQLMVGGLSARALIKRAGSSPIFVYSRDHLTQRVADLRENLPDNIRINYAIKANPFVPVLQHMAGLVDGFDIASAGELKIAQSAGLDPAQISFAGPGKRDAELEEAIKAGVTLNLESENEADRALAIGKRLGIVPLLAIRVNPDFELRGSGMKMGGGSKQFGIDQSRVAPLARHIIASGAHWRGLHIFSGSQALNADSLIEAQANVLDLADQLSTQIGAPLPSLNMGGGYGIPYFHGDEPVDTRAIGAALAERMGTLPDTLAKTVFCIELGRHLVGEAGVYLTEIIDRKESHGAVYLVTDGGLHHQLAASGNFGSVIRRNYPVSIATKFGATSEEIVNIVGCLCTPLDRLADSAALPRAEVGDLVVVFCAGAYGATSSPVNFLGHGPAAEILV